MINSPQNSYKILNYTSAPQILYTTLISHIKPIYIQKLHKIIHLYFM